jgi:hypothetical protein
VSGSSARKTGRTIFHGLLSRPQMGGAALDRVKGLLRRTASASRFDKVLEYVGTFLGPCRQTPVSIARTNRIAF